MKRDTIATLFRLELRSLLRDRRTVVLSIVLPVIVMPATLFAQSALEHRRQARLLERSYAYATIGENAKGIVELVETASERPGPNGESPMKFEVRETADPLKALADGTVDVVVEGVTGERARSLAASAQGDGDTSADDDDTPEPPALALAVTYRSDNTASSTASRGMLDLLSRARRDARANALVMHGFPVTPKDLAPVVGSDVAAPSQVAGARVARFLTILVVFFMMMGGAAVASDIIAGEKERGTIETLLTTAAERSEIVAAKLLTVVSVAIGIVVLEFTSLLVYASLRVVDLPADYAAILRPSTLAVLVALYLPVGALVASVLLFISGFAKSYKEAQLFFFPVMLLSVVPAAAAILPGITLRSIVAVVPLAGISVAAREVLVGTYDWPMLAVAWLATAAAAVWMLRRAAVILSSESLVTAADTSAAELTGGPSLFPKRVLRWYAVLWVAVFTASSAAAKLDVRWQVAINLLGIFLGGALLMIRIYRLDPREALALRLPHPLVWLGVLVGAPSGLLVGIGVARLSSYVLPVPSELVEQFGRELLPEGVPLWQMVLFLAVLPGICEEIAFRGLLLHGLRRRFRPAALCVFVGCVFGLFHFALFRLVPTAFLGTILAAVTVMSGSIFPSMLWHALNNGVSVVAALGYGVEIGTVWWHSAVAVVPLAASLWLIRRYGRGYPGLRAPGRKGE